MGIDVAPQGSGVNKGRRSSGTRRTANAPMFYVTSSVCAMLPFSRRILLTAVTIVGSVDSTFLQHWRYAVGHGSISARAGDGIVNQLAGRGNGMVSGMAGRGNGMVSAANGWGG